MKLHNFFCLTLSIWCIIWLNSVIVFEEWHHLLLNWSPVIPVFTIILSLPQGWEFRRKIKKSDTVCTLCPNSLVYTALLSNRWCWYELISSPCSYSPLPTTECLQATPSVGSSWDGPVYSTATYPVTVSSRFKLDLKERATTIEIKPKLAKMAAAEFLFNQCHATASASLLAH